MKILMVICSLLFLVKSNSKIIAQTNYNKEFIVNSTTLGAQWGAEATQLDEDKIVITWSSADYLNKIYGVYAQIFDTKGNKVGNEI